MNAEEAKEELKKIKKGIRNGMSYDKMAYDLGFYEGYIAALEDENVVVVTKDDAKRSCMSCASGSVCIYHRADVQFVRLVVLHFEEGERTGLVTQLLLLSNLRATLCWLFRSM